MKYFIFLLLMFGLVVNAEFSHAEPPPPNSEARGLIDYAHLDQKKLVIDDVVYIMPLNLKVYDSKGKKVNRYALKEGQSVRFFARYEEKQNEFYVDWVRILK